MNADFTPRSGDAGSRDGEVMEPDDDNELYVDLRLKNRQIASPDERLDAVIDFIGHCAADVPRLVAEVRRLRGAGR